MPKKKKLERKIKKSIEKKKSNGKKELKEKGLNKKLIAVLWFLLKFNLLAIPMYLIMYMHLSVPVLQSFVANTVHTILGILKYSSVVEGQILKFSADLSVVSVDMNFDCTGWKSMYALLALVIATPGIIWKKKLKFLAIGLPAVFAINIFRIVTTITVVINLGVAYLDVVHNILWQEGLITAVIVIWYLWLRKFLNKSDKT